jgi:predicted RNase H-like HicB family nuclease
MQGNYIDKTIFGNIGIITPSAEGGYVSHIPEMPGCITQGETVAECRKMLKDALRGWVEVAMESPWVSVKERLPEFGQNVLIFNPKWVGDHCAVGKIQEIRKSQDEERVYWEEPMGSEFNCSENVTHWMPLPAMPKVAL